ncbi:unnamed protein product, partial [Adineta ricciae]
MMHVGIHNSQKLEIHKAITSILTFGFIITVLLDVFYYSPSITFFTELPITIDGMLQHLLFVSSLMIFITVLTVKSQHGSHVAYFAFQKFVELIPLLIDLVALLSTHQYNTNSPSKLVHLSLILTLIRLIFSFHIVHKKCTYQQTKQLVIIIDISLFILVNTALLRITPSNIIRFGQKISLCFVIIQLHNLFSYPGFWSIFNKTNATRGPFISHRSKVVQTFHGILYFRLILSLFILFLCVTVAFYSVAIAANRTSAVSFIYSVAVCLITYFVVWWDINENISTLRQCGIFYFQIDFATATCAASPKSKSAAGSQVKTSNPTSSTNPMSLIIGRGLIEVEKGDIKQQSVDVIVGTLSSDKLRQALLQAAGDQANDVYNKERLKNPTSLIISTPAGRLPCKRIFFLKWQPNSDDKLLRQSIVDLMYNVVQNVHANTFTSIAFPAIGCGGHACSLKVVVKTMIREMKQHIQQRDLAWKVKFIIEPDQQNTYDEFCKQLFSSDSSDNGHQSTEKYQSIINEFDKKMKGKYTEIVKLECINNERWRTQYDAHWKDFKSRLNEDTEKILYHGCPEAAAKSIMQDCFNRSYAGINGTLFGWGVYFSSDAAYSHGYATRNTRGERCMFVARVLVGKTTQGNKSMKTRPIGFDSTTDG